MALKMTNREVDGVSVVALDGRIVHGEESNALREKVKGLIAEGMKQNVRTWTTSPHRQRRARHAVAAHTASNRRCCAASLPSRQ